MEGAISKSFDSFVCLGGVDEEKETRRRRLGEGDQKKETRRRRRGEGGEEKEAR